MTNAPTITEADPVAIANEKKGRGKRKRLLGNGEGDYCIYEIARDGTDFPKGSLLVIPEVPRFPSTALAIKWIRNDSGDLLVDKQVMILRACEIFELKVSHKPTVIVNAKAKRPV